MSPHCGLVACDQPQLALTWPREYFRFISPSHPAERSIGRPQGDPRRARPATTEAAIAIFVDQYQARYSKAVGCLTKDREALLIFFDFPPSLGTISAAGHLAKTSRSVGFHDSRLPCRDLETRQWNSAPSSGFRNTLNG